MFNLNKSKNGWLLKQNKHHLLSSIQTFEKNSKKSILTLVLLLLDLSVLKNTVDHDQMASDEGSTLFSTLIENACLQPECCR